MKLTFLGDVMCTPKLIGAFQTQEGYDFRSLFAGTREMLMQSDLVFGNLETPISHDNEALTSAHYCFNTPHEFAEAVYDAGIRVVATANNHCLDRGVEGLSSTIQSLDRIGLSHTGISEKGKRRAPLVTEAEGVRIGVLAYTYGTNAFNNRQYLKRSERDCVNLFQNQELTNPITRWSHRNSSRLIGRVLYKFIRIVTLQGKRAVYERREASGACMRRLKRDIREMKARKPDLLVLYMHAGGQYNAAPTKYTKQLTKKLLKMGVNIVVGSHEHVVHGGDFSRLSENQAAAYSLGNFDSTAGVYERPFGKMAEYSVVWNVYIDKVDTGVKFKKTSFHVIRTVAEENGKIKVVPVYKLLEQTADAAERARLETDMKQVASVFAGRPIAEIQEEYIIEER